MPAGIGGELCASPVVCKLSFTGSTAVGRHLMAQCAPTVTRLSPEYGMVAVNPRLILTEVAL